MNPQRCNRHELVHTRRDFLERSALGFGSMALTQLLAGEAHADATANPLAAKTPPFPAKAKNVIFLFMTGGPSHLETFDPKPELIRFNGQPLPASFQAEGIALQFMKPSDGKLMGSPFPFAKHGQS